jgi:hypothetical protein
VTFIPANGKVNYTQAKANCPIIPPPFLRKTKQKFITSNVKDETLRNVAMFRKICLQTREVNRNHNSPCDYTYTGSSGKQEVTLELR